MQEKSYREFGNILRLARLASGITQADLAHQASLSIPTVRTLEAGQGSITSAKAVIAALDHRLVWAAYTGEDHHGTALATRRAKRGMSQRQMAKKVGVSHATIVSLETKFTGRIETLLAVLRQLHLNPRIVPDTKTGQQTGRALGLPDAVTSMLFGADKQITGMVGFVVGDASFVLSQFPSRSVDCVITSPPYWNLREYENGGIGQEHTRDDFIDNLLSITSQLHRVIKAEGSFWLNMGDTYDAKKLQGLPWRVALRMVDEQGWIIRNAVIWNKRRAGMDNPTDRLPNRHETIFHFVKNSDYYYDAGAIRVPAKQARLNGNETATATGVKIETYSSQIEGSPSLTHAEKSAALAELVATYEDIKAGRLHDFRMVIRGLHRATHSDQSSRGQRLERDGYYFLKYDPQGSLPSDVWDIAPESSRGRDLHFAAYPMELCRIPILSTCPPDGIVIDPFCGTGTTMKAAQVLRRRSIGIDISERYVEMARARCR
jgi:site-specific DNA-methyltransferase (adenine-specific)